jgi:HEAT repeat protein
MSSTSLDTFRTILDHLDGSDRAHQFLYFRALHDAGAEAVPELALRVKKVSTGRELRQLVLESCYYYPWPTWVPMLSRMLRHESDLSLFTIGLHALGRIGDQKALSALQDLSQTRAAPEFQKLVTEELAHADPEQAFNYHLANLLEGSTNPSVANKAAQQLEELVDVGHLEALKVAIQHPDLLVFRHAIRLVARIPSPKAAKHLADLLVEYHQDVLEDRGLKELLPSFRNLTRAAAMEEALNQLIPRFGKRDPESIQTLQNQTGPPSARAVERIQEQASGVLETFLVKVLAAAQENNIPQLHNLPTEAAEEIHLRARRFSFAMDNGAEGLVQMVREGFYLAREAIPLLEQAVRQNTGREGLLHAFVLLVPAEASELLDLAILHPDGSLRAVAVEALGERNEEALRPALLKASHDPIADTAQQALAHLGRLPGAEDLGRELLHAHNLEEINLGISFIGMHQLVSLVPELVELVRDSNREELALKALEAIGHIGSPESTAPLLELLHSGQSQRLQTALAEAIRDLGIPSATISLCQKASELKNAQIHAIAVEGICQLQQPLNAETGQHLLNQIQGAWNEKNPWPLRLRVILALRNVALDEREQGQVLSTLVQGTLAEKRAPNIWSSDDLAKVQVIAKELAGAMSATPFSDHSR